MIVSPLRPITLEPRSNNAFVIVAVPAISLFNTEAEGEHIGASTWNEMTVGGSGRAVAARTRPSRFRAELPRPRRVAGWGLPHELRHASLWIGGLSLTAAKVQ
jgi:hypothetical protein